MLGTLLNALLKNLENGNWLVVIVIVFIGVSINLRVIIEFADRWGSKREAYIKEALKIETLTGATRIFLEEELNCSIFKKITEISADQIFREKIKYLIDHSNGDLQPFQFTQARKHLKMKEGELVIVITLSDRVGHIINFALSGIMFISVPYYFMSIADMKFTAIYQIVVVIGYGVLMFFFAVFLYWQTTPLLVAKYIEPIIKHLESNDESSNAN